MVTDISWIAGIMGAAASFPSAAARAAGGLEFLSRSEFRFAQKHGIRYTARVGYVLK